MRTVKADLHNHFRTTSYWRQGDFNRAVNTARNRLGLGGVVGLINFSDTRYETFFQLKGYDRMLVGEGENAIYVPEKDILVVKGQEVPTQQGHVLVLGLPKDTHLKERKDLADTIKEARDYNGIIVADHPFHKDGIGPYIQDRPELIEKLDAIEIFNGEAALWIPGVTPQNANEKAYWLAFENKHRKLGELSSSDGHSFYEIGRNWTALDITEDYESFSTSNLLRAVRATGSEHDRAIWHSSPQKLAALAHVATLVGFMIGAKIPKQIRELIGVEKHFDVPRPDNLGKDPFELLPDDDYIFAKNILRGPKPPFNEK